MDLAFFNRWAAVFMRRLMEDFDLTVEDAAAIIGNAGHESGGFQSLQEKKPLVKGSRGGYGIMQWTGPRRRAYEAYCKRNGYDPADMDTNYKFLFVELSGPEGNVLRRVKVAPDLDAKVEVFCKVFLRPGIVHMDSRKMWAKRALAAYKPAGAKPAPKPSKPAPATKPAPAKPAGKGSPVFAALIALVIAALGALAAFGDKIL